MTSTTGRMPAKRVTPPPTRSPLRRRGAGEGKLTCRPYSSKADRIANHATPYGNDERGRPLWKFVLRYRGDNRVIPARDWEHAHNESMKAIGRWDALVAEKRARRAARITRTSTPVTSSGWRWSDLPQHWLPHKREHGNARASTIQGYEGEIKAHFDPFFGTTLGDPALAEIRPDTVLAFRRFVCGMNGERRRARWNKLFSRGWEMFEFARALEKIGNNPWIAMLHRYPPKSVPTTKTTPITAAELDTIMREAEQHEDVRVPVMFLLAGFAGLRLDELTHLRVEDLTLTDTLVDVRVASDFSCACRQCAKDAGVHLTKSGATRYVPMLPEHGRRLAAHVERLRAAGVDQPDAWLLGCIEREPRSKARPGDMANRDTLASRVEAVVAKALGFAPTVETRTVRGGGGEALIVERATYRLPARERIHVLRHAARTRFSHLGLPSETIDLVMGHTLDGMRGTYTHQDRAAAFAALCERAGVRSGSKRRARSA
jgi:integrase